MKKSVLLYERVSTHSKLAQLKNRGKKSHYFLWKKLFFYLKNILKKLTNEKYLLLYSMGMKNEFLFITSKHAITYIVLSTSVLTYMFKV